MTTANPTNQANADKALSLLRSLPDSYDSWFLSLRFWLGRTAARRVPGCWPMLWLPAVLLCVPLVAADTPENDPVELGREALAGSGRFPWYDRRQDDVRRLNAVPRKPVPNRGDKWASQPASPAATTTSPGWNFDWFGPVLQWTGLTVLVLLLGLIAYLVATSLLSEEVSESAALRKIVETRRDADRVEALPFHVRAASGDFLAEARRLYQAGQYSEAIVYLFSWELVQLDKHHVIRLTKGKTNRQYLREARHRPSLAAVLNQTMLAFEDAFFGRKVLSREAFEQAWSQVTGFQAELQNLEQAAA